MLPPRILDQIFTNQWAIEPKAFEVIRSIVDGENLDSKDYSLLHSIDASEKADIVAYTGKKVEGSYYSSVEDDIGFLLVDGPIIPRATWMSRVSGLVSLDVLRSEFTAFEKDQKINKIVHLMDTPGGVVQAVSDYAALVFGSSKKTYTWGWEAASAGYWVGAASNQVIVPNTGMLGSVGVVIALTDYKEAHKKKGIKEIEIVSSQSPNKRPDADSAEGRAVYQKLVNDLADSFVNDLSTFRNVSEEVVLQDFGQGGLVVGKNTVEANMADSVMDFESFLKSLKVREKTYFLQAKENKMELDQLKSEHSELFNKVVSDAKEEERQRIKSIESLVNDLEQPLPKVKEAVIEFINDNKFDSKATKESIAGGLLGVVTGAQKRALEEFQKPRQKAEEIASVVSTDDLTEQEDNNKQISNEDKADKKRIDGMLKAHKLREQERR